MPSVVVEADGATDCLASHRASPVPRLRSALIGLARASQLLPRRGACAREQAHYHADDVMVVLRGHLLLLIAAGVSLVLLAPAAGSQSQKIYFGWPSWSHDGKRIVLAGQLASGESNLFVMNADGSGLHEIDTTGIDQPSGGALEYLGSPTWSPGDDRIAFWAGPDGRPRQP